MTGIEIFQALPEAYSPLLVGGEVYVPASVGTTIADLAEVLGVDEDLLWEQGGYLVIAGVDAAAEKARRDYLRAYERAEINAWRIARAKLQGEKSRCEAVPVSDAYARQRVRFEPGMLGTDGRAYLAVNAQEGDGREFSLYGRRVTHVIISTAGFDVAFVGEELHDGRQFVCAVGVCNGETATLTMPGVTLDDFSKF